MCARPEARWKTRPYQSGFLKTSRPRSLRWRCRPMCAPFSGEGPGAFAPAHCIIWHYVQSSPSFPTSYRVCFAVFSGEIRRGQLSLKMQTRDLESPPRHDHESSMQARPRIQIKDRSAHLSAIEISLSVVNSTNVANWGINAFPLVRSHVRF